MEIAACVEQCLYIYIYIYIYIYKGMKVKVPAMIKKKVNLEEKRSKKIFFKETKTK